MIGRHEWKFFLRPDEAAALAVRARAVLRPDPHGGASHRYRVRSLYFDDPAASALFARQTGLPERSKLRLRIYDGSDRLVVLERKHRRGERVGKERLRVDRATAERWIGGERSRLDAPLARTLDAHVRAAWRPACVVDYEREAYVLPYGNVRVTLDRHLAAARRGLFDRALASVPVGVGTILEVKFDRFLPDVVAALLGRTVAGRQAISKYALCRRLDKTRAWEDQ